MFLQDVSYTNLIVTGSRSRIETRGWSHHDGFALIVEFLQTPAAELFRIIDRQFGYGVIPGAVLAWTGYQAAAAQESNSLPTDSNAWFVAMLIFALVGFALLVFCFTQTKERVVMDEKETKNVKVSDLWTEFFHNRPLRIVALFFITAFAMMSVGNAAGAYFMNDLEQQSALAEEGIRWLVCVIPAILLGLAMFIISKYELTDEVIDDINKKIEARHKEEN